MYVYSCHTSNTWCSSSSLLCDRSSEIFIFVSQFANIYYYYYYNFLAVNLFIYLVEIKFETITKKFLESPPHCFFFFQCHLKQKNMLFSERQLFVVFFSFCLNTYMFNNQAYIWSIYMSQFFFLRRFLGI